MRFTSDEVDGFQVFAVAGTNSVSFGVTAAATARIGLLGFGVQRIDSPKARPRYLRGFKVFPSTVPAPTPGTDVSTYSQPVQSLVWDDFTATPGHDYRYVFRPLRGTPQHLDRSATPVTIAVSTEPLYGQTHDVFFNRGVASSQAYATEFGNKRPDDPSLSATQRQAILDWLSRDLDDALLKFIASAKRGDAIRGAFYEFTYAPVLAAFAAAIARGVDVKLVVDEKLNGTAKDPVNDPRDENLAAITASTLPSSAIIPRLNRKSAIAHNKFMVLVKGVSASPTEVWTGSTNLTTGGIHGQANVGHWVRDAPLAQTYLDYWTLLATDPGGAPGDSSALARAKNAPFYTAVGSMTPVPDPGAIAAGVTPLFSPRTGMAPMDLYTQLLATSGSLSCATFPFTIAATFKTALARNTAAGPLVFLLLDTAEARSPASKTPTVTLNSKNNVYEASGSELSTPLGRWVAETDTGALGLNVHVEFIHCKIMLHDPLGADPIVVSGSANFSTASTNDNDENMLLIRGDARVADIYFTEFNRLWNHYYFRTVANAVGSTTPPGSADDAGSLALVEDDSWLQKYAPGSLRTKRVDVFATMHVP